MSDNKDNVDQLAQEMGDFDQNKGVSGQGGTSTGPVSGGADNTRGENKPSREGDSGGAKKGKNTPDYEGESANHTTTTRGSDSSDKEFRNDQPNASTLKGHKNNSDQGTEK